MLGLAALVSPSSVAALVLLLVGFLSLGVLDPWAARRGETPLFLVRLRPFQVLLPIASLAALLLASLRRLQAWTDVLACRYSWTTMSVSSWTEVASVRRSKVTAPSWIRLMRSQTSKIWA